MKLHGYGNRVGITLKTYKAHLLTIAISWSFLSWFLQVLPPSLSLYLSSLHAHTPVLGSTWQMATHWHRQWNPLTTRWLGPSQWLLSNRRFISEKHNTSKQNRRDIWTVKSIYFNYPSQGNSAKTYSINQDFHHPGVCFEQVPLIISKVRLKRENVCVCVNILICTLTSLIVKEYW